MNYETYIKLKFIKTKILLSQRQGKSIESPLLVFDYWQYICCCNTKILSYLDDKSPCRKLIALKCKNKRETYKHCVVILENIEIYGHNNHYTGKRSKKFSTRSYYIFPYNCLFIIHVTSFGLFCDVCIKVIQYFCKKLLVVK